MQFVSNFLSNQNEVAEQFLSNARFSLRAASTASEKYEVAIGVSRSFAGNFAESLEPLEEWCNTVAAVEEEYMPSGPPFSPITHKLFEHWAFADLKFGPGNETLAECVEAMLKGAKPTKADQLALTLISNLTESRIGFYEVKKSGSKQAVLEDIVDGSIYQCDPVGRKGDLLLTRLLPDPDNTGRHFAATEPCLLEGLNKQGWIGMLRHEAESHELTVEELLKSGHDRLCWLEYVMQAYRGISTKRGLILLSGNLTDSETRQHSDGADLSPRYSVSEPQLPVFDFQMTLGQRKLIAQKFPAMAEELELEKSGRRKVFLEPETLMELRKHLSEFLPTATGSHLTVGRSLANDLDDRVHEIAEIFREHVPGMEGEAYAWVVRAKDLLFRFTLQDTDLEVVRYVKVPSDYDLLDLHEVLQRTFGWDSSHLHYFEINEDRFTAPDSPLEDCYDEEDIPLSRIFSDVLTGEYHYDLGDSWRVKIEVLRGYGWGDALPLFLDGTGPNPVEDCGGTPGFEELLRLLKNPKLKDRDDRRGMVDEDYDPHHCPSVEIQKCLIDDFRDDWGSDGLEVYVKRHQADAFNVQGKPLDVVFVVESQEFQIVGCHPCYRSDEAEVAVPVVREALKKIRQPQALVVEDEDFAKLLKKHFDLKVKVKQSPPEVNQIARIMESEFAQDRRYFEQIPQDILSDFAQAARHYYLNPLWREIGDSELFMLEGLTPQPLLISILGNAGTEYGLSVFEEIDSAIAMFEERLREVDSYFFLTYQEEWGAIQLRRELESRGLPTLPESAPLVLTPRGLGQSREYRLITEVLHLLMKYKVGSQKKQKVGDGVTVTWPILPTDLHELKAKQTPAAGKSKVGRNDPCWCGSGKKYKKCHLGKD